MGMKKYTDDYEIVDTEDEKGHEKQTVVYRGEYFEVSLDEKGLARFKRRCYLLFATIALLHISGGFVSSAGMFQFYVALPYVFAFFPLVYLAAGILRLPRKKDKYRRDEIGHSFGRMKITSIILAIFLGVGVLGEVMFLLLFWAGGQRSTEYTYLLLEAPAAMGVLYLIWLQRQIHIQVIAEQKVKMRD